MSLKWRPTLNYLGLMLATRVGPSLGQEPVATRSEQSEQSDSFLCVLLLMATIFGWWLRGVLELKLQRIRAGSLGMALWGWSDFSRSSGCRKFKKIVFLLTGVHHGWTRASAEGTEGMTKL